MNGYERKEFKYFAPLEYLAPLRDRLLKYMSYDPYCALSSDRSYRVRSIYFDTPGFLFYQEKLAGLKVRKKLRLRVYNERRENHSGFLEIKQKIENSVLKIRARLPLRDVLLSLIERPTQLLESAGTSAEREALERFTYFFLRYNLEPKVLVVYEREALIWPDNPDLRVTFDLNVRSFPYPLVEDLFRETDFHVVSQRHFILELKFNRAVPVWLMSLIGDYRLRLQAISKYCHGIDLWRPQFSRCGLL